MKGCFFFEILIEGANLHLTFISFSYNLLAALKYLETRNGIWESDEKQCGIFPSLGSKRFRLVSEQRKTEERDSRFWPRDK